MAAELRTSDPPTVALGTRVRVVIPGSTFDGATGAALREEIDYGWWVRLDGEWHALMFRADELALEEGGCNGR